MLKSRKISYTWEVDLSKLEPNPEFDKKIMDSINDFWQRFKESSNELFKQYYKTKK
jgi:hypothetical protein